LPHPPKRLIKRADKQYKSARETKNSVGGLIDSLEKLAKSPRSFSQVSHFQGNESVWGVFELILRSKQDSYWFGFGESFLKNYDFDSFVNNFSKKRRQFSRAKSYNIIPAFKGAVKIAKRGETDFQEFRFLAKNQNFDAGICVFGDKIAIFSYDKELSATLIEGTAIAEIARTMFMMIWDNLKAYKCE
jgi:hypothetical protein